LPQLSGALRLAEVEIGVAHLVERIRAEHREALARDLSGPRRVGNGTGVVPRVAGST
jgi:hypothetical protein